MNILKNIKQALTRNKTPTNSYKLSDILNFFQAGNSAAFTGSDLSEITYFTCMKMLAESIAKLSLHIKDDANNKITNHDVYWVTRVQPNPYMTPTTFKMLMEFNRNHYGDAYAYVQHKGGKLSGLYPLKSSSVRIWVNDTDIFTDRSYYYQYTDERNGKTYWIRPDDMIHLKGGISQDGICGMCVREVLARNMQGNKAAQNFLNDLYSQGLTANAVVKYIGDLDTKKKQQLVKELTELTAKSSDRIIPLPLGMDIVPLNLKLTDSQFYELKKYSSLQIAAAFGIKPDQLNNYEKSSYANSEMQNLSFYIDTLLVNLTAWEEELDRKLLTEAELKLGISHEFNVATILRGDIKTQAEALQSYVGGSIYKINEARKKAGLPPAQDGDVIIVNGSYVQLGDVGKAYAGKGGSES